MNARCNSYNILFHSLNMCDCHYVIKRLHTYLHTYLLTYLLDKQKQTAQYSNGS